MFMTLIQVDVVYKPCVYSYTLIMRSMSSKVVCIHTCIRVNGKRGAVFEHVKLLRLMIGCLAIYSLISVRINGIT